MQNEEDEVDAAHHRQNDADVQLEGGEEQAADQVAEQQGNGTQQSRGRDDQAVVAAEEDAGNMGDQQADEADQAAIADSGTGQNSGQNNEGKAVGTDMEAQRSSSLFAQGQNVHIMAEDHGQQQSGDGIDGCPAHLFQAGVGQRADGKGGIGEG